MALINCPECGKEISDKAINCIHCGFPLNELKTEKDTVAHDVIFINEKEYDLTNLAELMDTDLSKAMEFIRQMGKEVSSAEAKQLKKRINEIMKNKKKNKCNITVECPFCHSKNTVRISWFMREATLFAKGLGGIVEASKQWHCNACRSDF